MAEQNTDRRKVFPGCMDRVQEMMQMVLSRNGGSCCAGMEKMAQMMAACCPVQTQEESPADKTNQKAPE